MWKSRTSRQTYGWGCSLVLKELLSLAVSQFCSGIINIANPSSKLSGKIQMVTIPFEMPLATDLYPKYYQLIMFTQQNFPSQRYLAGFNLWWFIQRWYKMVDITLKTGDKTSWLNMINTNDDGKDLIRKLSSSIIFDARQTEIQLKYTAQCRWTCNRQQRRI